MVKNNLKQSFLDYLNLKLIIPTIAAFMIAGCTNNIETKVDELYTFCRNYSAEQENTSDEKCEVNILSEKDYQRLIKTKDKKKFTPQETYFRIEFDEKTVILAEFPAYGPNKLQTYIDASYLICDGEGDGIIGVATTARSFLKRQPQAFNYIIEALSKLNPGINGGPDMCEEDLKLTNDKYEQKLTDLIIMLRDRYYGRFDSPRYFFPRSKNEYNFSN